MLLGLLSSIQYVACMRQKKYSADAFNYSMLTFEGEYILTKAHG